MFKKKVKILSICIASVLVAVSLFGGLIALLKSINMRDNGVKEATNKVNSIYYATADEDTGASTVPKEAKGGAVFLEENSNFTMKGGSLLAHGATYGGAVYISNGATFTMQGGEIKYNVANYGGAIYVASGGTCIIESGTITSNYATVDGNAIYVEDGGTLTINEGAVIEGNSQKTDIFEPEVLVRQISEDTLDGFHYINWGYYPQTYVGDSENVRLETWFELNSPTCIREYLVRTKTWQAYLYTDGNIYVRGESYPYAVTSGYIYSNGDNVRASGNIAWFKVEPITWYVLNYDEVVSSGTSQIKVLSRFALTADIYFNSTTSSNSWSSSYIRTWLNGTFYDSAFTDYDKQFILPSTVKNNSTGSSSTVKEDGTATSTTDNIFLMSYTEMKTSPFPTSTSATTGTTIPNRLCSPTDFALSNYCYHNISASYYTAYRPSGGTTYWWLRSAGTSSTYACYVNYDGQFGLNYTVTNAYYGVRPALSLIL